MAMTKESMAANIKGYMDLVTPVQGTVANISAHRVELLEAFCQGIIDELVSNAEIATTSGAPNSEHIGNITA